MRNGTSSDAGKQAFAPSTPPTTAAVRATGWLICVLIALACLVRLVHLDADPYFPTWIQYVVDEGRWNESARNLALFGVPEGSWLGKLHLTLSPAYQAVNYFAFRLFGVTFASARVFAAICGILVVLSVFGSLARSVSRPALLLGLIVLGFETNLLAESRLALPEIPALLGMLLAFLLLVVGRKTLGYAMLAGILAAAAVGLKGTSLLIVPVLWLVVIVSPEGGSRQLRVVRALGLTVGFLLPVVIGLTLAVSLGFFDARGLTNAGSRFFEFLSIADPRLMVWRYLESAQLEVRNLMLLGVWWCSWIWFHRDPKSSPVTRDVYLMSGLWAGWWLVLWTINDYSPGRYVVHFVVPATIHIMAGLSLAGPDTVGRIARTLGTSRGLSRVALRAWLVLPSAIFATTVLAALAADVGIDATRASTRLTMMAVLVVPLAMKGGRKSPREGAIAGLLVFPVLMTMLWLVGRETGIFHSFWRYDFGVDAAVWLAINVVVAVACWWLGRRPIVAQGRGALYATVMVLFCATFVWQGAHPVVAPTYSMRDASQDIGRRFTSGAQRIFAVNASSVFLGNNLRYKELSSDDPVSGILVVFEHNLASRRFLRSSKAEGLVLVQTYPLTVHPRYEVDAATFGPTAIGLYVRN